jgi:hypothetical protein
MKTRPNVISVAEKQQDKNMVEIAEKSVETGFLHILTILYTVFMRSFIT